MTWKMIPFDKLFNDRTGGNKKLKQSEFLDTGLLPIVDQGQEFIAGYTNDEEARCNVTLPCITFGDHTRAFKLIDFPFALGADGVKVLQPTKEVDARYAFFYLNQVKLAGKEGYQRNFKYLKQVSIPLPPLSVQKRIAAILEKADAAREKRRQANKLTEQFLQSAFLEMFGDPVTNPKGRKTVILGDVTETITKGETPLWKGDSYLESGVLFLRSENVFTGSLDLTKRTFISQEVHERMKKSQVKRYDVLLNIVGASIGRSAVFEENCEANINQAISILRTKTELLPNYLSFLLNSERMQIKFKELQAGVARDNLNLGQLRNLEIYLPAIQEQQRFAALVEKVELLRAKQRESEKELENLFQSLMQRAFRGELVQ